MYFVLMGEWNPLNKLFTVVGRLLNPSKGKHVLKRDESHLCEVWGFLLVFVACYLRFLTGFISRKLVTKCEQRDRF